MSIFVIICIIVAIVAASNLERENEEMASRLDEYEGDYDAFDDPDYYPYS